MSTKPKVASKPPTRSAFAPIRPGITAIAASGQERGQPEAKSRETAASAAIATVKIDLLAGLIPHPDKRQTRVGAGVSFFTRGKGDTQRGIAVALNPKAAIVARALERNDKVLAAFLVSELFGEFLFLRRKAHPLIEILQAKLAANVFGDPNAVNTAFQLLVCFANGLSEKFIMPEMPWPLTT